MEAKLKHLDFIQGVISRMATNSFLFKGWAITVASGLSAFGIADDRAGVLALGLVSTVLFWALDGYYLWLEREFRHLYSRVAAMPESTIDFAMEIEKRDAAANWMKTCGRKHLSLFYGSMALMIIITVVSVGGRA